MKTIIILARLQTSRQCVYVWSCDKDGGHIIQSAVVKTPCCSKLHDSILYRTGVITDYLHCRNGEFCAVLLLWPWTWPDDLHTRPSHVSLETYSQTKHKHSTSRLSKVTVLHSYIPTYIDRHTDRRHQKHYQVALCLATIY